MEQNQIINSVELASINFELDVQISSSNKGINPNDIVFELNAKEEANHTEYQNMLKEKLNRLQQNLQPNVQRVINEVENTVF